jgi:hypothetical protein
MDAIDPANYDFTIVDRIMPHPHYAAQHFVCVLNPGEATLTRVHEMLGEAYELAVRRKKKKKPSGGACRLKIASCSFVTSCLAMKIRPALFSH